VIVPDRQQGRLAWLIAAAAFASAAAASLTLFLPDVLLGPAVTNGNARGTALVMLVLGAPLLLAAGLLQQRGWRWAPVMCIGLLAYLAYNGFMFLTATPYNRLFLVYVLAMSTTVFALGASVLRVEPSLVAERLPRVPARVVGGYILTIVVLNTFLWLSKIVRTVLGEDPTTIVAGTGVATNPVFVQDLVFWLPSAFIIGWLAWTRRPYGALLAGAYLVYGVLESVGVAVDQWFGTTADPTTEIATMGAVYLFAVLAVIGIGALVFYAWALQRGAVVRAEVPKPAAA
jgi:hypothetical protein